MKNLFLAVFASFFFSHVGLSNVVISDQSGNPVVLQIGQDYQWNDTLDGVMLWGVWQDDDTNEWVIATVNYIGGRQKGAKGSYSSLPAELDVDHPYIINGDTIDVTETNGHQYYQVTSVEGNTIYAVDGDGFPLTDPSWWFVTMAAAEEFYNSKLDNAPSALTGLSFSIDDVQTNPTPAIDFPEVEKYFSDQFIYGYENSQWQEYPYIYTKISGFDAELTILYEDGNKTYYLTFSDDQNASGNWSKNSTDENTSGSTQFTIITDDLAPETLSTWYYETDPLSDWIYFKSSVSANFFYDYFPETNSSFVENITYKWEKLGPSIGRITMDTDEETWLFFSNLTYGYYDLSSKDGSFESSGIFQLSKFDDGLSVDDLSGDKITIGEKHYIFHEGNEVSTLNQDGSSTLTTYAYIRTDQNEAILSVADGLLVDMKFLDYDYGRITNGGSGYFEYHSSYATKGWLWYDDLPWIFSSNQGDWIYQYLFINDSNETELMYQFKTSGVITKSGELDYIGESNLSKMDAFYWDDYDDFSGTELNSSKWGTMYLGGGVEPYVLNGKLILSADSGNSTAPKVVKSGWEDIFQNDDGGQAWVYPMDNEIMGIEAEFVIPGSANSMSGLSLGVASLYPYSYATAELNADPNSASQYSQGFGFYHYLVDGSELEYFDTTQRDTTHKLGATFIEGEIKLYVDGEIRYEGAADTFNTDMFFLNGFNDYQSQGLAFELAVDNVRVLRKKYYPKGWMWMDYYPWAYSAETGNWLYFKLTKDVNGLPGMIFWDESTNAWELYQP